MRRSRVLLVVPSPAQRQVRTGCSIIKGRVFLEGVEHVPPLGAAYVAAAARADGHEVRGLEVQDTPRLAGIIESAVREFRPDVVGASCIHQNLEACVKTARAVRAAAPRAFVVLGGPHASAVPGECLAAPEIDAVVVGEGEETFRRLLAALGEGGGPAGVPGVVWRGPGGRVVVNPPRPLIKDIDSLPMPAWDDFPLGTRVPSSPFLGGKVTYALLSSRGCPFACTFCATHAVWGRKIRCHGVERVLAEMNRLNELHGAESFIFYDDTLTLDRARVLRLCRAIEDGSRARYDWCCNTRADLVDAELLSAMRRAGCRMISFGVESASPRLLARIKKGVTAEESVRALRLARAAGIETAAHFILGLPTETREESLATIRLAASLRLDYVRFSFASPLPGSEMFGEAAATGAFVDEGRDAPGASPAWVPSGRSASELRRLLRAAAQACGGEPA